MFVESYGQVAVQGSSFSPRVDAELTRGTSAACGGRLPARSGWLTSPTFGGISWLAHSTLQSGVWVEQPHPLRRADGQRPLHAQPGVRARRLADGRRHARRTTATGRRAPSSTTTTRSTTAATSATAVPPTPTRSMPDQYVLLALQRLELAKPRPPARSSPRSTWCRATRRGSDPAADRLEPGRRRLGLQPPAGRQSGSLGDAAQAYGRSIQYSLSALVLVRPALRPQEPRAGDAGRPPAGQHRQRRGPSHDVPISIISPRPGGAAADLRLGLERPACGRRSAGAGLADERLPRPLPGRVRLAAATRLAPRPPGHSAWNRDDSA